MEFEMKSILIVVFLNILWTSLQEESLGLLSRASIYNAGVSKVNENENITFKCRADNIIEGPIYMYLFKNGERVKMETTAKDDVTFNLTKLTAKDSGLYICLSSKDNLTDIKTKETGHNNVSLEVLGKFFPATITGIKRSVKRGDGLTLTCTFTNTQNCTQIYVYLCLNGIGNKKKQVNCRDMNNFTSFLLDDVSEKNSGNYSCVYSVSNYSLSEVNNAGENTIFVQVHDGFGVLSVIISVLVAALVVLLVLLGFWRYRDLLSFKVRQDPDVRNTPNIDPFYHEIMTGSLHAHANGKLTSFGENSYRSPVEDSVDSINASYSTVQSHGGEEPVDKNDELNTERVFYDSVRAPYAVVQRCIDKTKAKQVQQSFTCKPNVIYSLAEL